jgi:hypothetical protein
MMNDMNWPDQSSIERVSPVYGQAKNRRNEGKGEFEATCGMIRR